MSKIVRADDEIYREEERVRQAPIEHFIGPKNKQDTVNLDAQKSQGKRARENKEKEREAGQVSSKQKVSEGTLNENAKEISELLKLKYKLTREIIEGEEPNEDGGEAENDEEMSGESEKEDIVAEKPLDEKEGTNQVKQSPVLIKKFGRVYRGQKSTDATENVEEGEEGEEGEIIDEENQEIIDDMNFMPSEGADVKHRRDSGERKHKKKKKHHHHKKRRRHSKENDDVRESVYDEESGSWREPADDEMSNKKRRHSSANDTKDQGDESNKKPKITKPLLSEILLKTRAVDSGNGNQGSVSVSHESPESQRFDAYSMRQQNDSVPRQLAFDDGEIRQFSNNTVQNIAEAPWHRSDGSAVVSSDSITGLESGTLESQNTFAAPTGIGIAPNLLTSLPSNMWENIKSGIEMAASASNSETSLTSATQSRPDDMAGPDITPGTSGSNILTSGSNILTSGSNILTPSSLGASVQAGQYQYSQSGMSPSNAQSQHCEDPWQTTEDPWQTPQNQQIGEDPWKRNDSTSQNQQDPWLPNSQNERVSEDPWRGGTPAMPAEPRPLLSLNMAQNQPPISRAPPLMSIDVSQSSFSKAKSTQPPVAKVPPWSTREIPDIKPVKEETPIPPWERKKLENLPKPPPPPFGVPPSVPASAAPPMPAANDPPVHDPWSAGANPSTSAAPKPQHPWDSTRAKYGESVFSGAPSGSAAPATSGASKPPPPWENKPAAPPVPPPQSEAPKVQHPWDKAPAVPPLNEAPKVQHPWDRAPAAPPSSEAPKAQHPWDRAPAAPPSSEAPKAQHPWDRAPAAPPSIEAPKSQHPWDTPRAKCGESIFSGGPASVPAPAPSGVGATKPPPPWDKKPLKAPVATAASGVPKAQAPLDSKAKCGEKVFSGGGAPKPQYSWDKKPAISHGQSPLAKLVSNLF